MMMLSRFVAFFVSLTWQASPSQGQASASGIPAMDFGLQYLNFPQNIPRSLAELLTDGEMGGPDHSPEYNPGECAFLPKCFAPKTATQNILNQLQALPNVAVFLNTTVVKVSRDDKL